MSLALVPLMAEPITPLSCSFFAPIASATFAHCAATKAAAEATSASLSWFDSFFEYFYVIWRGGEGADARFDLATDFGTKNLVSVMSKVLKFLAQLKLDGS